MRFDKLACGTLCLAIGSFCKGEPSFLKSFGKVYPHNHFYKVARQNVRCPLNLGFFLICKVKCLSFEPEM